MKNKIFALLLTFAMLAFVPALANAQPSGLQTCIWPGASSPYAAPAIGGVAHVGDASRVFVPARGANGNPVMFVDAGGYSLGPIAPGEDIQMLGNYLAGLENVAAVYVGKGGALPSSLGGTTVYIGGKPAALFSAGWRTDTPAAGAPSRITAQVPFGITPDADGKTEVSVVLTVQGKQCLGYNSPFRVSLAAVAPTPATTGDGKLIVQRDGDVGTVYGFGFGELAKPTETGVPFEGPLGLASETQVKVMVGGKPATVTYAGVAPQTVGLYQVNFLMPDGANAEDPVTVSVTKQ